MSAGAPLARADGRPAGPRARPAVSFRVIHDRDRDFLFVLYATMREWEFALTIWTDADKADFLKQQFEAQERSYRSSFPGAVFRIIVLDGVDVGRLTVDRRDDCLHLIDLALLPDHRGRGIGTDILRSLLNEAHGGKVPVRLNVQAGNPALRLYLRHGFRQVGRAGHHLTLEWRPDTGPREI